MAKHPHRYGGTRELSERTLRRRYKATLRILDQLDEQATYTNDQFLNMKGDPNEIASMGGAASAFEDARWSLSRALGLKPKKKAKT